MLLVVLVLIFRPVPGSAEDFFPGALSKTVVLDPGHGGHDVGAKGSGGVLEKTVTLDLARKIAAGLKDRFRVVLTRTDDYWIDIPDRTAVANNAGAALFVSLHAGAGFRRQQTGVSVFFFREASDFAPSPRVEAAPSTEGNDGAVVWDTLQSRHMKASQELARLLHQYLIHPSASKPGGIQGAPMMVLRGADMPAALVEPGYLTNPVEEKLLTDPESMALIAERIGNAIMVFLEKSE